MLSNDCAVTELQRNSHKREIVHSCKSVVPHAWYLHNILGCTVFKISYLIPLEYNHVKRKAVKRTF